MGATTHRLDALATPACLDRVHELLDRAWLDAPDVARDDRARFALITSELVTNVIEHGGHGLADPPHLELIVEVRGAAVCGTLSDDGAEPPPQAPDGRRLDPSSASDQPEHHRVSDDEILSLRESGRGLPLVHSVADELALTRVDGRNRWRFAVRPHAAR